MQNDLRTTLLDVVGIASALRPAILAQPRHADRLTVHREQLLIARRRMAAGEPCEAKPIV